jgi:prepilin-type N-terminal cleavage/methylation domain-containing protein
LTTRSRRGFTLVELMVATVAMLIVGGAAHQLLQNTQQLTRAQTEQLEVQSNVRGGVIAVVNELRELGTSEGGTGALNDLLSIGPTGLTYRAMRGMGFTCQSSTAGEVRISRGSFSGHRTPQAGRDSAFLLIDGDPNVEPTWVPLAITTVSTASSCPGVAGPAITLSVVSSDSIAGAAAGRPVRIYEIMELRLYESEGSTWLGMRSVSTNEAIQPLFGPLSDSHGFRLEYLDWNHSPVSDRTAVKTIRVSVRGSSAALARTRQHPGAGSSELELTTQVGLRNARP